MNKPGQKRLPYKTIEPPEPPPAVTILTLLGMILLTAMASNGKVFWVEKYAFTAGHMSDLLGTHDWAGLLSYMFTATGAQFTVWLWPLNAVFTWVFGYVVERKMKNVRFGIMMFMLVISGWFLVFITAKATPDKMYLGPSMLLFGLLGAYFAYFPKLEHKVQQWIRPNTEIFRNEKETPLEERYWVSPWLYVIAFVAYQVILQVALNFDKETIVARTHLDFLGTAHTVMLGTLQVHPSAFQPIAAIISIAVGFVLAKALPAFQMIRKPVRPGGKMQVEVIQHYRELRTLDLTHEQACEGAAKFAAVPIDIAKDWISKGSSGLKDQDLR
ncbi:MAG TPA: rhomboid family intramembrane serine protease [Candidatus Obscuribacterales bacterium]